MNYEPVVKEDLDQSLFNALEDQLAGDFKEKKYKDNRYNFQKNLVTETRKELRKEEEVVFFNDIKKRGYKAK